MTLKEAYQYGQAALKAVGNEAYHLDAFYLLEHVSGKSRAQYYLHENQELGDQKQKVYQGLICKRAKGIPLQHLLGVQAFMGLTFQVSPHVLIPRQDTEVLVETALGIVKETLHSYDNNKPFRILDMCTGSACVILSILHYVQKDFVLGVGVDISEKALEVARQNKESLGIKVDLIQSDLFEQMQDTYQMIVSNPPYIKTAEIESLSVEVREHDPMLALDGKADGLFFYRKIVKQSFVYLEPGGYLIFEIGSEQGIAVKQFMKEAGFGKIEVIKDLAGRDRVVLGRKDSERCLTV
ncbi:MAG: peptide chain release factor N(5)-glutamine methyltransferase [Lachnospiraceae bacterium]|nr:peptide chain release factor N(5)-glutamine methyltransferase [Lachnospiraceae bacterium]